MPLLTLRSLFLLAGGLITAVVARAIVSRRKRNPRRLPYAPGPKGKLFVGNLSIIPRVHAWIGYHELCKEYGDIVRLTVIGRELLVLGSMKRVTDLLNDRAVNYSDRPTIAITKLGGFDWSFPIMPYGPWWRQHRRAFHQHFNQNAVPKYIPIMCEERAIFLSKLKADPGDWFEHVHSFIGTTLMRATYGFDDIGKNASLIHLAEAVVRRVGAATIPGRYLVNTFPFLKYVPGWMPGAKFQQELKDLALLNRELVYTPFEDAKTNIGNGRHGRHPNMATALVKSLPEESSPERGRAETLARNVCAISYIGGSETSIASAVALCCALANNPEVQRKAQEELDAVVGADRLPLITDRPDLPYLNAVVKELARWYTPAPVSLIHMNTEDDEYDGYFIPKGTTIFPNVWSIMHDPENFERPFDFIPERFIEGSEIGPASIDPDTIFGFGRRVCPGKHMADTVIFLFAASIIANFDITPPKDEHGNPVTITITAKETGAVAMPYPFECNFAVRSGRDALLG